MFPARGSEPEVWYGSTRRHMLLGIRRRCEKELQNLRSHVPPETRNHPPGLTTPSLGDMDQKANAPSSVKPPLIVHQVSPQPLAPTAVSTFCLTCHVSLDVHALSHGVKLFSQLLVSIQEQEFVSEHLARHLAGDEQTFGVSLGSGLLPPPSPQKKKVQGLQEKRPFLAGGPEEAGERRNCLHPWNGSGDETGCGRGSESPGPEGFRQRLGDPLQWAGVWRSSHKSD